MVSAAGSYSSKSFLSGSLETSKEESKYSVDEESPNMQIVPSKKNHLTKAEYITKYIESFEEFIDIIKYVFPENCDNEDENKREYEIFCNSCYNDYIRRLYTANDPGIVLDPRDL